ncbi:MAG: hypothetical protein GY754_40260 [bacterium]|nr:hypothetical protein [bacterium]
MYKRIGFLLMLISVSMLILSCGKTKYIEYAVYPVPEGVEVLEEGVTFAALKAEIPEGSHIYGNPKGPGIGKPTEVFADPHEQFIFEPAQFLAPEKYLGPGETKFTWVYNNETKVFLPFRVKKGTKPGNYTIKIRFESLMCTNTTCIPRDFTFEYPVTVLPESSKAPGKDSGIMEEFNNSVPPEMPGKGDTGLADAGTEGLKGAEGTAPEATVISPLMSQLENEPFVPRFIEASNVTTLIQAILFGLLAGFILNFMPCVLPVVSLKVMALVKHADKDRKELTLLGVLFSLGILVSFAALALLAAFFGYSWGGLFQHKLFIVIMTAIVFVLSLTMFEVFVIHVPSFVGKAVKENTNHYADAFMKGLLATLLATPCSGPFLGGTLAWALSQPPYIIFIIFMSIGTGMALPYLVLTINPGLLKFVPKPGEWMRTFENIMGFLLIFTVVYLLGILDANSILPMIMFLAFLAVAFWQYGRFGAIYQGKLKRIISTAAVALIVIGGYFLSFEYLYKVDDSQTMKKTAFSLEELYKNRESGNITMIKFTADWCPNCKLVENLSLYTPKIKKTLAEHDITLMVADITRESPEAQKLLRILGSRSIPFLAIMPPGESFYSPICLRDIYSEDDVLKGIEEAVKSRGTGAVHESGDSGFKFKIDKNMFK